MLLAKGREGIDPLSLNV